ncbi:MAG: hypothetical protein KJZ70_14710, partial [Bryobacterales bacterium]|nr:hypothetical protein [Bryobacterales bacterium]
GKGLVESGWEAPAVVEGFRGKSVLLAGVGEVSARAWFEALGDSGLRLQRSQGLHDTLELLSRERLNRLTDVVVFDTKSLEGGASEINRGIRLVTRNPQLLLVLLDSMHGSVDQSVLKGVDPLLVLRKPISPYRALGKIVAAYAALSQTPRKPIQRLISATAELETAVPPVLVFAVGERRRKGLGYLLRHFSMGLVTADNYQDLVQNAAHREFSFVLLDADLGTQTEMEVAQKLRASLSTSAPNLVAIAASSASRAFLADSKLFDAVLDAGFQREDLGRVVDQFASRRPAPKRASVS